MAGNLKEPNFSKKPVIGAENEWHGIHHLARFNIKTMTPAGYGSVNRNPAHKQSFIITEALEDTISLEDYCGKWQTNPPETPHDIRFKRWLIDCLAKITRIMHSSGANHRDYYLVHFLLREGFDDKGRLSPEQSELFIIDLHRMQLRKNTPYRWRVKDVAGLYFSSLDINLSKKDIFRFMKGYSEKSLHDTLREDAHFWKATKNRGLRVYRAEKRRHKQAEAQDTPQQTA